MPLSADTWQFAAITLAVGYTVKSHSQGTAADGALAL
jgi:hypothetical protein